jgi:riboflavin synthase
MFTGIIEETGIVRRSVEKGGKKDLYVENAVLPSQLKLGDSVSCQGICLTVTYIGKNDFAVEIMHETLEKTTARTWIPGTKINLERALLSGGRLDGHIVQGHVDTTTKIISLQNSGQTLYLELALPQGSFGLMAPQGSIAIDGVSLTIAKLNTASFQVALIGFTLQNTTLQHRKIGDLVNLEYDILGKYVQRQLPSNQGKITESWLHEQGF